MEEKYVLSSGMFSYLGMTMYFDRIHIYPVLNLIEHFN